MKKCDVCNSKMTDKFGLCPVCGRINHDYKPCPHCGREFSKWRFCLECGHINHRYTNKNYIGEGE